MDRDELIVVYIEGVIDIEEWKEFLLGEELSNMIPTVNEEKIPTSKDFLDEEGFYSISINCSIGDYLDILLPYFKTHNHVDLDMISVLRTDDELMELLEDEE